MSKSDASSQQQQQQPQQPSVRKTPFSDWPTIKIFIPPEGPFSQKSDEWCLTYSSQSIAGRVHNKEPNCRTICLRRVFPHEIQNIVYFKKHKSVDSDGKAKYPLPAEGQPINLPSLLGGTSNTENRPKTKYWDEGWYFWTGRSRWSYLHETNMMVLDLQKQEQAKAKREKIKEVWNDYQEQLKRGNNGELSQSKWRGKGAPPEPSGDTSFLSLLVPLPPDFRILEKVHKLLKPSYRVLDVVHDSFTSGKQKRFALQFWEKAKSGEAFVLARWAFRYSYEQFRQWKANKTGRAEDDGKKDKTKSP